MLDYVLKNGTVIDGTGRAGFRADVAVRDGTIAGIGQFDAAQARVCVDAAGKAVTPTRQRFARALGARSCGRD